MRVPKNLDKPIDQVKIIALPDDIAIYKESKDPLTGKIKFQIDQRTITIVNPLLKKNLVVRAEN